MENKTNTTKTMNKQSTIKPQLQTMSTISKFASHLEYNQVKLHITSGIISQINTQLCSSFSDFYGFLLGNYKHLQNTKSSDNHSNIKHYTLSLVVDQVIFIYDRVYLKDKLERLIDKITQKNIIIIGLLSARSFSYPNISLREQEFYNTANSHMKKIKSQSGIPLLFGCFTHNVTEETNESKVKSVNFYSKMYMTNEEK